MNPIQEPSPNRWQGRDGQSIVAIVDHITQGQAGSVIAHFLNPDAEASTHFMVTQAGEVYQFVPEQDTAWGNGIVNNPDKSLPWLVYALSAGVNVNKLTLSIEHEGFTGHVLTETQYQASLELHRQLIAQFNIPVDRVHIVGHYQIDSVNRAFCPGLAFPWDRLMHDLVGTPEEEIPSEPNPGGWRDPVTGYWVVPPLAAYYCEHGGLADYGRPIGGMTGDDPRFPGLIIQDFERDRLEIHPDGQIMGGRSNAELVELQKNLEAVKRAAQ